MRHSRVIGAATGGMLAVGLVAAPALADPQVIRTQPMTFSARVVAVKPGETVTFENADMTDHNVAWDDNAVPPEPAQPQTNWDPLPSRTFTTPGTYRFYCTNHGAPGGHGMAGEVIVNATGTVPPQLTRISSAVAAGVATIRFSSTAAGRASGTVFKRNTHRVFKRFGAVGFTVKTGINRVKVKGPSGRKLATGAYRLDFTVRDKLGNQSVKHSASFKVK